ncbi:hypothetical protein QCA50_014114 [Cerrena zonata]|uniref:DUF6534 domain-containing protein n=1 Tax=Cerrena zonata TaxID=2478898 RepID=A0AAW0FPR4_9APHY
MFRSCLIIIILQGLTEVAVRGFYIYRVWIFSRNLQLLIGMITLLATFFGLFLVCLIRVFEVETEVAVTEHTFQLSMIASWSVVICTDMLIATTMVYYLHHASRKSQVKRTQGVLDWLILYFVSSGVILVAFSGSLLICFVVNGSNLVWAGIMVLYARCLSNSFFGALNVRKLIRSKQGQVVTFGGISLPESTIPTSLELHQVQVQVSRDTTIKTDSNPTLDNESSDNKCGDMSNHVFPDGF